MGKEPNDACMTTQTVGFLLGAGVSLPCNAPSTAELTGELLQGEIPHFRHTDGRYYRRRGTGAAPSPAGVPDLSEIRRFLGVLHERVETYYAGRVDPKGCSVRLANYEDLAYLAVQIYEGLTRERDNPALTPFIDDLCGLFGGHEALQELADEAIGLVTDHVSHRLAGLQPKSDHLACLRAAQVANRDRAIQVVSLNNDCLIEAALTGAGIAVNDMTEAQEDGRRIVSVVPSSSGVNLYKLHGSIDWSRWRPETEHNDFWGEWVGFAPATRHRSPWISEGRPIILVGRFNKELSHAGSPFAELFAAARASLSGVTRLVVSGYSFGDKAVNTMLVEWLYSAPRGERRLIVAHANPDELRNGARGAIGNKWVRWIEAGALIELPTFLGDLSWQELSER